jgi:hypothetical protein
MKYLTYHPLFYIAATFLFAAVMMEAPSFQDRMPWLASAVVAVSSGLIIRGLALRLETLEDRVRFLRDRSTNA